jgi:uncharacterized MnhB-related membrane protein
MLRLLPHVAWPFGALKLLVIWMLVMAASAGASQLVHARSETNDRMETLFSIELALLIVALAIQVAVARETFAVIVGFVAFELLLSLIWMALSAPDVALTEAVLGGGVTGALLLTADARLRDGKNEHEPVELSRRVAALLLNVVVTSGLIVVVLTLPAVPPTLARRRSRLFAGVAAVPRVSGLAADCPGNWNCGLCRDRISRLRAIRSTWEVQGWSTALVQSGVRADDPISDQRQHRLADALQARVPRAVPKTLAALLNRVRGTADHMPA